MNTNRHVVLLCLFDGVECVFWCSIPKDNDQLWTRASVIPFDSLILWFIEVLTVLLWTPQLHMAVQLGSSGNKHHLLVLHGIRKREQVLLNERTNAICVHHKWGRTADSDLEQLLLSWFWFVSGGGRWRRHIKFFSWLQHIFEGSCGGHPLVADHGSSRVR